MSLAISLLSVLPVELVFKVISFIDERKDLLALALTCRTLEKTLIPDHINHLEIHCPPHMLDIWDHLLKRPVLWQCVKTLGLTHSANDTLLVPPKFRTLKYKWQAFRGNHWNDEESLTSLYELLPNLENLTCFRVVIRHATPQSILNRLSETLKASGCNLERLEIDVSVTRSGHNPPENLGRNISFSLPSLHSLSCLSISVFNHVDLEGLPIIDILTKAPSLTQLKLHLPHSEGPVSRILDTLFALYWPYLKHLTVEKIHKINIDNLKLVTFFKRHTTLETLYFDNMLLPGCFPTTTSSTPSTLRSLHYVSRNVEESILRLGDILPKSTAKNLIHLSISGTMNLELGIENDGLSSLETCILPSLKDNILLSFIPKLVKAAPNLQKCCIPLEKTSGAESAIEILPLFRPLKNLTHLFGLLRQIETTELSKQSFLDTFLELASLTYIIASSPQGKSCIRLVRQQAPSIEFEIIPFHFSYRRPEMNLNQWNQDCFYKKLDVWALGIERALNPSDTPRVKKEPGPLFWWVFYPAPSPLTVLKARWHTARRLFWDMRSLMLKLHSVNPSITMLFTRSL
ncbi:hypothetical protein Clacol_003085 [Clathrus columnatus]|uniref:F-box domain-containing protein n=1 Tax=Clathrus columnatus TaxID=1419009 RepID=A0AAV5A3M2_9AGAM|nr:hypothetical protein Clacol_003085 [Clathrus columnatus]